MHAGAGRPYGDAPLDEAGWRALGLEVVHLADLTATQEWVSIAELVAPTRAADADPALHVVAHDGRLYLDNGHHRAVRALLRGDETIYARVHRP